MSWRMPSETAPHERIWMAFPCPNKVLNTDLDPDSMYHAWSAVANAIIEFEPVSILVDPSEVARARSLLSSAIEIVEAPVDECWLRDHGPTFVVDDERPGVLGAVDWTFNGWGAHEWTRWEKSGQHARIIAERIGAELISSTLVNEGGGFHVDGQGTVLLTETVQLDPRRNPFLDRSRVEAELARTIGATTAIWLPRGLTRDCQKYGTNGHVDIVATFASPGKVLLHQQTDRSHPDYAVSQQVREILAAARDAHGRALEIVEVPAPGTLRDDEGWVDYSYINHLVVNGGVIACGFADDRADATASEILQAAYPGRRVATIDARAIFAAGGGIHCITQQQPKTTGQA